MKKFTDAEFELIQFDVEDVITTSDAGYEEAEVEANSEDVIE